MLNKILRVVLCVFLGFVWAAATWPLTQDVRGATMVWLCAALLTAFLVVERKR